MDCRIAALGIPMSTTPLTMAQQVAEAVRALQQARTGHAPRDVTVILSDDTLVVTLHEALSPVEIALARTAEGAAQVQEYHRRLFESSAESLRQEIRRITGVAVHEAAIEVETTTGIVVHAFPSGRMVQVFRLAGSITTDVWDGNGQPITSQEH
jgi:uncharacterized protein YbcI